jgi:pimeloyl-ACP methyl ester carboxylesterase
MPSVAIDGITTRYEIVGPKLGAAPPLLMYAPGGFNATIEAWSTLGIYAKIKLLDHLPRTFTCILFDRRECGQSGGRVEPITWMDFVAQGKGLLDHLGIPRAHIMGGCMGCGPVAAFGTAHPQMVASMILFWPVGGYKYRLSSHKRFAEHLGFVRGEGLKAVVELVQRDGKPFGADPRGGPWASVIKRDADFAKSYAAQDPERYMGICETMRDALFDRDTAPGAPPEDLVHTEIPALIVPGHDDSHATSAARYLDECLPLSEYWDMPVERQSEDATNARVLEFLAKVAV